MNDSAAPTLSVIVPMYNAERLIDRCLAPLLGMQARGEIAQIIVVDDCATDGSAARVRAHPTVELTRTPAQGGPGAARNLGATLATGSHLWFVDSDVIVADDAARVLCATLATTKAAAVIGSYDDSPAAGNFLSQYKNLVHHYYHHRGKAQASTFWGGCGAVERALFLRLGGFDAKRYRYPSIEDIEFGYRIGDAGARIVLEPRLQGKHLKEWRFVNLVHTEVFRRALPWTRLMLERKDVTNDLNVGFGERARAILALATMAAFAAWAVGFVPGWVPCALALAVVAANASFVAFFVRARGILFAVRALLFHQFYYAYSSAAFGWATITHYVRRGDTSVPARS
jgi:glycosyltransferase involved in cell wall biosynthesis